MGTVWTDTAMERPRQTSARELAFRRRAWRLPAADVAGKLGITETALRDLERGETAPEDGFLEAWEDGLVELALDRPAGPSWAWLAVWAVAVVALAFLLVRIMG